jgi:hypothetical protein
MVGVMKNRRLLLLTGAYAECLLACAIVPMALVAAAPTSASAIPACEEVVGLGRHSASKPATPRMR